METYTNGAEAIVHTHFWLEYAPSIQHVDHRPAASSPIWGLISNIDAQAPPNLEDQSLYLNKTPSDLCTNGFEKLHSGQCVQGTF